MAEASAGERILIVEDDRALRDSITRALRLEGYRTSDAGTGPLALSSIESEVPDLVILDLGLPELDGLTVCRVLRAQGRTVPILVLTARSTISDRVEGLDAGADDFMGKPFALEELLARVRALLRRASTVTDQTTDPDRAATGTVLELADLVIDAAARTARRGDRQLELTKTEFELLELLVRNEGIVLDRSTIYLRIWGYDFGPDSKNLTVYLGYLRTKTEAGGEPRLLHTVRGVGYVARLE